MAARAMLRWTDPGLFKDPGAAATAALADWLSVEERNCVDEQVTSHSSVSTGRSSVAFQAKHRSRSCVDGVAAAPTTSSPTTRRQRPPRPESRGSEGKAAGTPRGRHEQQAQQLPNLQLVSGASSRPSPYRTQPHTGNTQPGQSFGMGGCVPPSRGSRAGSPALSRVGSRPSTSTAFVSEPRSRGGTHGGARPGSRTSSGLQAGQAALTPSSPKSVLQAAEALDDSDNFRLRGNTPTREGKSAHGRMLPAGNHAAPYGRERKSSSSSDVFPRCETHRTLRPYTAPLTGMIQQPTLAPVLGSTAVHKVVSRLTATVGGRLGASDRQRETEQVAPEGSEAQPSSPQCPAEEGQFSQISNCSVDASPVSSTTNGMAYGMREADPEAYDEVVAACTGALPTNRNFDSQYDLGGDGFSMFMQKTAYAEATERQAVSVDLRDHQDLLNYFEWFKRQRTYYGELMTEEAAHEVDQWLGMASGEEKLAFLEMMRKVHIDNDPYRNRSLSHSQFTQKSNPVTAIDNARMTAASKKLLLPPLPADTPAGTGRLCALPPITEGAKQQ